MFVKSENYEQMPSEKKYHSLCKYRQAKLVFKKLHRRNKWACNSVTKQISASKRSLDGT